MNILLADDSEEKIKYISEAIHKHIEYTSLDIAHSYNSTTKLIRSNTYDLMILDMSMPVFDTKDNRVNQAPKPLAGRDIMSKLKYRNINIPVIIVTQFDIFGRLNDAVSLDNLTDDLASSFPNIFKGCVFYDPQGSKWQSELINLVQSVIVK